MEENDIGLMGLAGLWIVLWNVGIFVFLLRQDRIPEYFILILIHF